MIIHNVTQGSAEWHALRAAHNNASEAPAMMGASKYLSRNELLALKKTGIKPEVSSHQQMIFDRGHESEAMARPHAEAIIGEELYPVVGTSGKLLASMDGMTMLGSTLFEHKLWNEGLADQVRAGELGPHYYWQLEQQLLVAEEAERVLFMVSDGTPDRMVWMWYTPVAGRAEQLRAGWDQFERDLVDFVPEPVKIEAVGRAPVELPALRIELQGLVTASNLDAFKSSAIAVFKDIKRDLVTDQDFADAAKTVKWCGDIEDRLKAAKEHALGQTQSIDQLFRAIDEISAEARSARLELEKLVKARQDAIRLDLVKKAVDDIRDHYALINKSLGMHNISTPADINHRFGEAIKGKRTIASLKDALGTAMASAKIEASQRGDAVRAAVAALAEASAGYEHLFADRVMLCATKAPDDIRNLASARIAEHRHREEARLQAERERIRQQEAARIEREHRAAEAAAAVKTNPALVTQPVAAPATVIAPAASPATAVEPATGATIKLGDLNALIAPLSITADGLAQLGFQPVGTERAAKLYRQSDFPRICAAMVRHIQAVQAPHTTTSNLERNTEMANHAPAAAFNDATECRAIPMTPVASNQVKAIGYDPDSKTLAVTFTRGAGAIYHYPAVEPEVYANFIGSESVGKFFGEHIKQLPFKKFEATQEAA